MTWSVSARLPLFPHTTTGLKDMFRSAGGKAHKGSPRTSAKPMPKNP